MVVAAACAAVLLAACSTTGGQDANNANNIRVCGHYRIQRAHVKNLAEPTIADALRLETWVAADAAEATPGTTLASDLGDMASGMAHTRSIYAPSLRVIKDCTALGVTFQP